MLANMLVGGVIGLVLGVGVGMLVAAWMEYRVRRKEDHGDG